MKNRGGYPPRPLPSRVRARCPVPRRHRRREQTGFAVPKGHAVMLQQLDPNRRYTVPDVVRDRIPETLADEQNRQAAA